MILAAGQGTRLRPLTDAVPKPMIPVAGLPLLARTLRWLGSEGVDEAAINLYHRPQAIPDYFGDEYGGVRLHYFFEDTLRGTAGGVKGAARIFRDEPFYVIYGDNLISADLRRLRAFHQEKAALVTIALFSHPNPSAAGIVGVDEHGRITAFVEKPPPDEVFSDLANAGVYVCEPDVLDQISDAIPLDFGRDVFPDMLLQGLPLYGAVLGGYIQDTGTPDQYRQANWDVLDGLAGAPAVASSLYVGDQTRVAHTARLRGRNVLGSRVDIGAQAELTDCILWDDVRVGANCVLKKVILGNGVVVADGEELDGSVMAA
jgi:mannose-1-phosphate guanylyltransferase/phosphomannomutase